MIFQSRYVAYCRAHQREPEAMLEYDRERFPGGCMCGFLSWSSNKLAEFRNLRPDCFLLGSLVNHVEYDKWLASL